MLDLAMRLALANEVLVKMISTLRVTVWFYHPHFPFADRAAPLECIAD